MFTKRSQYINNHCFFKENNVKKEKQNREILKRIHTCNKEIRNSKMKNKALRENIINSNISKCRTKSHCFIYMSLEKIQVVFYLI